jgi:hypothetical protein
LLSALTSDWKNVVLCDTNETIILSIIERNKHKNKNTMCLSSNYQHS